MVRPTLFSRKTRKASGALSRSLPVLMSSVALCALTLPAAAQTSNVTVGPSYVYDPIESGSAGQGGYGCPINNLVSNVSGGGQGGTGAPISDTYNDVLSAPANDGVTYVIAGSTGGAGGIGGGSANSVICTGANSNGGSGGQGGNGGTVTITTTGGSGNSFSSTGIYVYSAGGIGGAGGSTDTDNGQGGGGGTGGAGGQAQLTNWTPLTTTGSGSVGIAVISLGGNGGVGGGGGPGGRGGDGGAGGDGGSVILTNYAAVEAQQAIVIYAQSVGGYGADGGGGGNGYWIFTGSGSGGDGGYGAGAGTVSVTNSGALTSGGLGSRGIEAQSVGGAGGDAGVSQGLNAIGANGGPAGNGSTVTISNSGTIALTNASSVGIAAQSIGGGGGSGGLAFSSGVAGVLIGGSETGGNGGGGGYAGTVSVTNTGNTIDRYAADASAVVEHLDLRNVVHIGHSTGGGEVARYVARYGQPQGRVAKAVLVAAIPPLMLKTPSNPEGTPIEVFDGFRAALAANRSQFYLDVASGPFYGFNRPGAKVSQGIIQNWWRQGMMGGALAQYEGIKAFSETDQTEDLKAITVPTLVLQGDDDQVVPYKDAAILQAKLLKNSTLKIYPGFPHGMLTTHADVINPDLLAFVKG